MRESGSVKLYWSLSCGPGVGGLGVGPRGFCPFLVLPDSVVLDVLHFMTHEISHFYHEIAPPV